MVSSNNESPNSVFVAVTVFMFGCMSFHHKRNLVRYVNVKYVLVRSRNLYINLG